MVRAFETSRIQVYNTKGKRVADSIQKSKVWSNSDQRTTKFTKHTKKMLLLWKNTKKTGLWVYGKKYLKCKKLNYFASVCRSKYKINKIDDTNSTTESDHDINELYLVGSSVITKDNEITLDTTNNYFYYL